MSLGSPTNGWDAAWVGGEVSRIYRETSAGELHSQHVRSFLPNNGLLHDPGQTVSVRGRRSAATAEDGVAEAEETENRGVGGGLGDGSHFDDISIVCRKERSC